MTYYPFPFEGGKVGMGVTTMAKKKPIRRINLTNPPEGDEVWVDTGEDGSAFFNIRYFNSHLNKKVTYTAGPYKSVGCAKKNYRNYNVSQLEPCVWREEKKRGEARA